MEENPQKTIGKDEIQNDLENVEYRPIKKKSVQQIDLGNDYEKTRKSFIFFILKTSKFLLKLYYTRNVVLDFSEWD